MSKVYVICTGGTISMLDVNDSQNANKLFQDEVKRLLPTNRDYPEVEFKVYSPLVDSSEMNVTLWNQIGADIRDKYYDYDGFVILHGTDTMAYTGSALSFMLGNLSKPVILTGAQTPLSETINDARENLINGIFIAGNHPLNEVCIYFDRTLYRANRVTKISTNDYGAYMSPNYPSLGQVQSNIEIDRRLTLSNPDFCELTLTRLEPFDIRYVHFHPLLSPEAFSRMIDGAKAVIIGSYGDGNISIRDSTYLSIIKAKRKEGVVFVNKSQCLRSQTIPKYDAGELLINAGMICAGDQTIEALIAKLTYLFSRNESPARVEKIMASSLRGELTPIVKLYHHYSFFQAAGENSVGAIAAASKAASTSPSISRKTG